MRNFRRGFARWRSWRRSVGRRWRMCRVGRWKDFGKRRSFRRKAPLGSRIGRGGGGRGGPPGGGAGGGVGGGPRGGGRGGAPPYRGMSDGIAVRKCEGIEEFQRCVDLQR